MASSTVAAVVGAIIPGASSGAAKPATTTCPGEFSPVTGQPGVCEVTYETATSYTFSVPSGVSSLTVLVVGAGGGGGGNGGYSAGGGGGGGQVILQNEAVTPGEKINVSVGQGGTGGSGTQSWSVAEKPTHLLGLGGTSGGSSHVSAAASSWTVNASGGTGGMAGFTYLGTSASEVTIVGALQIGAGGTSGTGNKGGTTILRSIANRSTPPGTTLFFYNGVAGGGAGSGGAGGTVTTTSTPTAKMTKTSVSGDGGPGTTITSGLFAGDSAIFGAGGAGGAGGRNGTSGCTDLNAGSVTPTAGGLKTPAVMTRSTPTTEGTAPKFGGGGGGGDCTLTTVTGFYGNGQDGATGVVVICFSVSGQSSRIQLSAGSTVSATDSGAGYVLVHPDGGVFAYKTAIFYGSLPGDGVSVDDITSIASTCDSGGYWLAGADGGVFAFGDAVFYGSLPNNGVTPVAPIVAIAPTPDCGGYWLVGRDGGVFAFGGAQFYGSLPHDGVRANNIVGITATTAGYEIVGSDGGVFAFGDGSFYGSLPSMRIAVNNVVGISEDVAGDGYFLVASDGGVFAFGTAWWWGSLGGVALTHPVVGLVGPPSVPCGPLGRPLVCSRPSGADTKTAYELVFATGDASSTFG